MTRRRRRSDWVRIVACGWIAPLLAFPAIGAADDREIDFARDIRPILSDACIRCHGPDEASREADLRLDRPEDALRDRGGYAAIVPGAPDESELYLRLTEEVDDFRMPPPESGKALTTDQIELIRRWIEDGARWSGHWAFRAPTRPEPPPVADASWGRNPIDRFILGPLDERGIDPSPAADRATLIRRASLDVTGLPPSPEEVRAFIADDRPDAYGRLIDRLLASPHFGERWGRIWLDVARYADSNGYSIDAPREIWPYRDWVIGAFNRDLPFDDFTIDQLAGDLRPGAATDQVVATGFHRNTPINQEGGIDPEQFRIESVIDRVNTTGTAWLGLTVGCAQCHDHKYDPISQREYYQLFAFLNTSDEPSLPLPSPEDLERRSAVERDVAAYLDRIEDDEDLVEARRIWESSIVAKGLKGMPPALKAALAEPRSERDDAADRLVLEQYLRHSDAAQAVPHREAIAAIERDLPEIPTSMVIREQERPRETHLLLAGDFTRPGDRVHPDVPEALPALPEGRDQGRRNRLDLARWIVDPSNPLTARVAVNRIWQVYFGRGLVETDEDFGSQGAPPSHPELLDWLALEFVRDGWSPKAIHRLILDSNTYRQSSNHRDDLAEVDPTNRLLARQRRLRIEAELIRDAALEAGGLLNEAIGGPSVFPPQPEGVMTLGQMNRTWEADTGPDRDRRTLYTFFWRATPHPLLVGFDAPDSTAACTRRARSNTPLQALMLLNDRIFLECARALADRVRGLGGDDGSKIEAAYRICLARAPDRSEAARIATLLESQRARFRDDPEAARSMLGDPESAAVAEDLADRAAWLTLSRVLLNLDEFITRE